MKEECNSLLSYLDFPNPSPLLPNFGDLPVPCLVTWQLFRLFSLQKAESACHRSLSVSRLPDERVEQLIVLAEARCGR